MAKPHSKPMTKAAEKQNPAEARREKKRAAILAIGRAVFFKDGYAGTSMSEIAAKVGGSKGTLYSYFPSKEALFRAVLEDYLAAHSREMESTIEGTGPPGEVLLAFSKRFLDILTRPENLALIRLIYSEAGRFPEVGKAFYDAGPSQAQARLADYMTRAREAGYLRADLDPLTAARQHIVLSQGWIYHIRLWNIAPPQSRKEMDAAAEAAVTTFMAAYGAE